MRLWRRKRVFAVLLLSFLVFLFLSSNWVSRLLYPIRFTPEIRQIAQKYELDPFFVAAIIRVESNYEVKTVSRKGAFGLMQLMPDTSDWIIERGKFAEAYKQQLHDPAVSIELGSWYLNWMQKQFNGNMIAVIAGYNAGHGKVSQWLQNEEWDGTLSGVGDIPYGETRHYIQRVTYYHDIYKKLYEEEWRRETGFAAH